jgi:hypothetical protein
MLNVHRRVVRLDYVPFFPSPRVQPETINSTENMSYAKVRHSFTPPLMTGNSTTEILTFSRILKSADPSSPFQEQIVPRFFEPSRIRRGGEIDIESAGYAGAGYMAHGRTPSHAIGVFSVKEP